MASEEDDAKTLSLIQETYVPFLKKLIAFSEKNKKVTTNNVSKLKTTYTIFTTGSDIEKLETFHANEAKLKNWYDMSQKEEASKGGKSGKRAKRSNVLSDNESSPHGVPEVLPSSSSTKKICTSTHSVNSASTNQNSVSSMNAYQLRKRKIESPVVTQPVKAITTIMPAPLQPEAIASTTAPAVLSGNEPIMFNCAACLFQTHEEHEFMKHARTDHRTDLSMWCKQCSTYFSNAGYLVSHIKERACVKEEMIYKCGVKDCVFETTSGQTFVYHVRNCHKGSPFIFCVHCQAIFTLAHCLILHMQDDCPFKHKNRKNPSCVTSNSQAGSQPVPPPSQNTLSHTKGNTLSKAVSNLQAQAQVNSPVTPNLPVVSYTSIRTPSGGRGRGRGRGKVHYSDSNDSNDPDDPSWRPKEMLGEQNSRRSGRWAKKINDVMNPEPTSSGSATL